MGCNYPGGSGTGSFNNNVYSRKEKEKIKPAGKLGRQALSGSFARFENKSRKERV
jgi:hypothetical protein